MAKSVQNAASPTTEAAAPNKGRFRVVVKGYPVTGFVDQDKRVHARQPVEVHYRRPAKEVDSEIPDGWHTERQLRDSFGFVGEIPKEWRRRKRVRMDLTSALFEGAVVAADFDHEAQAVFMKTYGLNGTAQENWKIKRTLDTDPLGPFGPKKLRGLLRQDHEPGAEE